MKDLLQRLSEAFLKHSKKYDPYYDPKFENSYREVCLYSEFGKMSLEQDEQEPTKFVLTIGTQEFVLRLES